METCKLCVSIPGKSLKIDMPRPFCRLFEQRKET